jgi:DNA-binding PadR family transcriptional regulator
MFGNRKKLIDKMEKLGKLGGLRIWILYVLGDGPKNGVEIIDAIQEKYQTVQNMHFMDRNKAHREAKNVKKLTVLASHVRRKQYEGILNLTDEQRLEKQDSWRPSNGSVYPMLKKMVVEDLISKMDDGRYDLAEQGKDTFYKVFGNLPGSHDEYVDHNEITIETALTEISGYISCLEDFKSEKLAQHKDQIRILRERLKKLDESINQE